MQAGLGTSQDCGRVLDPATVGLLGSGPLCRFASPAVLAVVLGSEASIQPQGSAAPDVVALLPDAIGSAAGGTWSWGIGELGFRGGERASSSWL